MDRAAPSQTERQQALIRALQDPRCYPHPADRVERLETHISTILLAGDYAYKLKKPLRLAFLDYSTLERRQHYCMRELELNRKRAPTLYLACVPITGTTEAPTVGGDGPALDYAVQMRRFPEHCRLDHLVDAGSLDGDAMEQLGRELARLHAGSNRAEADHPLASVSAQAAPIRENIRQLEELLPDDPRIAALRGWTDQQLRQNASLLRQRITDGRIRDCHGDLHLANLVRIDDRFQAFDGIEFDEALRWIDVLNDLAFLLMDLDARDQPALGARVLNAWLDHGGDHAGMPLLRLYQGYRALVRAKINAIRLQQVSECSPEADQAQAELDRYLALASGYAQHHQGKLWVMGGLSGSGKSTHARRLLEQIQGIRLRSDVERKRLYGLGGEARTGSAPGAGIYSAAAGRRTYAHLRKTARRLLRAGWPVIIDAACLKRAERDTFRRLAATLGVPCELHWCQAEPTVLRQRVSERQRRGNDPSEADTTVLERQLASYEPPAADEPDVHFIDTGH